jgi:Fe-S oxidoreductase
VVIAALQVVQRLGVSVTIPSAAVCCGYGGTFAMTEQAISVRMGQDRLREGALDNACGV